MTTVLLIVSLVLCLLILLYAGSMRKKAEVMEGAFEVLDDVAKSMLRDLRRKDLENQKLKEEIKQMNAGLPEEPTGMNIGGAIFRLERGDKVKREGWNGKEQYLEMQRPDKNSKMTLPYIYITTVQGDKVPWLASQTDLLARDWKVVK